MKIIMLTYLFGMASVAVLMHQDRSLQESMKRGKELYTDFCITCHLENGEGVEGVFPPLANSDYLMQQREASIRGVKFGQSGEITVNGVTYNNMMMDLGLESDEVADVMNYILNSWGNQDDKIVTSEEVEAIKDE